MIDYNTVFTQNLSISVLMYSYRPKNNVIENCYNNHNNL